MYPYPVLFGAVNLYEICVAAGLTIAFVAAYSALEKRGFSAALRRLFTVAVAAAIAFGFVGAVLFQAFYDFLKTGVFQVNDGTGMTFYGGFLVGVAAILVVWTSGGRVCGVRSSERTCEVAEVAACAVPLGHAFGRIGCFFAGCCHGLATESVFGVSSWTESGWQRVLPVQLYEAAFLFLLSGVLFTLLFKRKENGRRRVPLASIYLVAYGAWRFCIEFWRGDDRGASLLPCFTPSQVTAIACVSAGAAYAAIIILRERKKRQAGTK